MKPARNEDEPREFFGSSLSLARARGKKPTLPAPVLLRYLASGVRLSTVNRGGNVVIMNLINIKSE